VKRHYNGSSWEGAWNALPNIPFTKLAAITWADGDWLRHVAVYFQNEIYPLGKYETISGTLFKSFQEAPTTP
jgi:hypothetical protein